MIANFEIFNVLSCCCNISNALVPRNQLKLYVTSSHVLHLGCTITHRELRTKFALVNVLVSAADTTVGDCFENIIGML